MLVERRVLDLEECRGIGADSLAYALTGLPALRVLNLGGNPEVSDALLSEAALAAPLREVSLCRCALSKFMYYITALSQILYHLVRETLCRCAFPPVTMIREWVKMSL